MSNSIFPTIPGMTAEMTRTPVWSTTTKTSVSQRGYRLANSSYPLYRYKLGFEFLRQAGAFAELGTLAGFFNARQGAFDTFLFRDPDDNTVAAQAFGTGDGATRTFQLIRSFGFYAEPVFDLNGSPSVYVGGALKVAGTHYTVSAVGVVTFVTPPGAGVAVTWTGSYYRRCAFTNDAADFEKFMGGLWLLKSLEFVSVKP